MESSVYLKLRETAARTAKRIGTPSFYVDHRREVEVSAALFRENKMLRACRSRIDESTLHPAHGLSHCDKVAVEAGAIVLVERKGETDGGEELLLCAHLAGLLHDITRREKDHSISGSIAAERMLKDVRLEEKCRVYVAAAIRNHEAFKEVLKSEDDSARLVSDALYDADKFRWGPDNFTTTLWLMVESSGTPSLTLYSNFQEKMTAIKRIKETFRSGTGRRYGPEFIDLGVEIGNEIYSEMGRLINGQ